MNVIRSEADLLEINHKAANNKGKTFYYYLANDVTLTKRIHVWEGCTFVICLHGHTLTCNVPGAQSAFFVMNNARLVFTDCQLSGDRGLITGDSCAAVSVDETATFELYGVSICMTSSETDGIRDIYTTRFAAFITAVRSICTAAATIKRAPTIPRIARSSATSATPSTAPV